MSQAVQTRALPRTATGLPMWPVTAPLLTYPIWWLSGLGELALVPFAVCAVVLLRRRPSVRIPRGLGAWLIMLVWVAASVVQLDTGGRLVGAGYRLALYAAITVLIVYIFNAWSPRNVQAMCGACAVFLLYMTLGALAGLMAPLFELTTPLALILPDGLLANELVTEMAYRRLTNYDPTAYNAENMSPRPSAPFLYTNGWGNSYSLILPLVLLYVSQTKDRTKAALVIVLIAVSTVPAALTLNRGMFLGLAVGALYFLIRAAANGRWGWLIGATVLVGLGAVLVMVLPIQERLEARDASSGSTATRLMLYQEAWERTLQSPVVGYGAPRPSLHMGSPSVGTQGQFWATLFSHGFFAAAALMTWLAVVTVVSLRRSDALHLATGAVGIMAGVEILYYGFIPFGFLWVGIAAALVFGAQQRGNPVTPA
jgi:hypothetical protein